MPESEPGSTNLQTLRQPAFGGLSHPLVMLARQPNTAIELRDPKQSTTHKENHMDYDYSTLTANPDGYLNWALGQLGAALSVRTETALEVPWINEVTALIGAVPDPMIRARLASTCSLRQLRVLVRDEHLAVRLSCVDNPFAIDRDIQITLCEDGEIDVVRAFLNRVEPCAEAAELLSQHRSASIRSYLASPRRKRALLSRLAHDEDKRVRDLAQEALVHQSRVAQHQHPAHLAERSTRSSRPSCN